MHFIKGNTSLEAWKEAVRYIVDKKGKEEFNLIVCIKQPTEITKSWIDDYNPKKYTPKVMSTKDTIKTIFPYNSIDEDRNVLYKMYLRAHRIEKRKRPQEIRWGSYFERMINYHEEGKGYINQIEKIIKAISTNKNNHKAAYAIHISSPVKDSIIKIMGNPCLQYVQFLCTDKSSISMLCVYRNHDYYIKTLGNFIGLGYLLSFICRHTNRSPGELICHSAHAYLESKHNARNLARI